MNVIGQKGEMSMGPEGVIPEMSSMTTSIASPNEKGKNKGGVCECGVNGHIQRRTSPTTDGLM